MRYVFLFLFIPNLFFADIKIGAIGDSNSYWHVVDQSEIYYKVAEKNLREEGYDVSFIRTEKSCQSGSGTESGLERIKILLDEVPDIKIILISLGINDAIASRSILEVNGNLEDMIEYCLNRKVKVMLGTVDIAWYPWHRIDIYYRSYFQQIYTVLSYKYSITIFPFIFYQLFQDPKNHIGDFIHPTAKGHKILAKIVEKSVKDVIDK